MDEILKAKFSAALNRVAKRKQTKLPFTLNIKDDLVTLALKPSFRRMLKRKPLATTNYQLRGYPLDANAPPNYSADLAGRETWPLHEAEAVIARRHPKDAHTFVVGGSGPPITFMAFTSYKLRQIYILQPEPQA